MGGGAGSGWAGVTGAAGSAGVGGSAGAAGMAGAAGAAGSTGVAGLAGMDAGLAGRPDATPPGCPIGLMACDGVCVDVTVDASHCGSCGLQCSEGGFCVGGRCHAACEVPLVQCAGSCVDLQSHGSHCGSCGNVCASGICELASCQDKQAGHLVVIGHDFKQANDTMRRMAGNAVFLARGARVRALLFEGTAHEDSITGIGQAIDFVASRDGRAWTRTKASDATITRLLADSDVFVVYPQAGIGVERMSNNRELARLQQLWANALAGFLGRGGVVVLFEGPAMHDGTYQVLGPTLFAAGARQALTSGVVRVDALGDAVALGASQWYAGRENTVRFVDFSSPGSVVAQDPNGDAVVVHRVLVE